MKPFGCQFSEVWDRIWFSRFDPISASVFRVFLGSLIVVVFIALFPSWEHYYGADGILSLHDPSFKKPRQDVWTVFYWTEAIIPIKVLWWVGVCSALAFTVGWQTRLATITLFVLYVSMVHRNVWVVNGEDLVIRMLLFFSCFAPLNCTLSVDSWVESKHLAGSQPFGQREQPYIWPIRLMQINVLLIYLISVPGKLVNDIAWINGDAIYLTMASNMWSRYPWPHLFYAYDGLLSKIATYGTILIEGTFPFLVWFEKTRLWSLAAITLLHLGIAFLMSSVTFFTLAMVCSFWLFVPPSMVRVLVGKLSPVQVSSLPPRTSS